MKDQHGARRVFQQRAQDAGGYARAEDERFYRRQRELLAPAVAQSNVVVTTGAVPGGRAPLLLTAHMVAAARDGRGG